jgi:predicted RNase H-like HicB family nuclease
MRYAVVIEQGLLGFSAYVPDLPGCVAAGSTRGEVLQLIRAAIQNHIERLHSDGRPIPAPVFSVDFIEVGNHPAANAATSLAPPGSRTF